MICACAAGLVGLALLAGCDSGGSAASDSAIKRDLQRGVAQIRSLRGAKQVRAELKSTLTKLRRDEGSTAKGRRGNELAIRGFEATVKGLDARVDFDTNDSGNVAAALRDARRADRFLREGADYLRRAGAAFDLRVGMLNGY